ncbi:hypothetical protein F5Y18DRAFT_427029 [Xylariaceae sp. FL1019]|nr:hypothetical protein F5Y18DRAFT_427029 [Xylariaceae sp. FL1019]
MSEGSCSSSKSKQLASSFASASDGRTQCTHPEPISPATAGDTPEHDDQPYHISSFPVVVSNDERIDLSSAPHTVANSDSPQTFRLEEDTSDQSADTIDLNLRSELGILAARIETMSNEACYKHIDTISAEMFSDMRSSGAFTISDDARWVLDAFANIFCLKSSPAHITATVMLEEQDETSQMPTGVKVLVAKNGGHLGAESKLAEEIEKWFTTEGPFAQGLLRTECVTRVIDDIQDALYGRGSREKCNNPTGFLMDGQAAFQRGGPVAQYAMTFEATDMIAQLLSLAIDVQVCSNGNPGTDAIWSLVERTWVWAKENQSLQNLSKKLNQCKTEVSGLGSARKSLRLLGYLCRLPRAVERLELFRGILQSWNVELKIQLVHEEMEEEIAPDAKSLEMDRLQELFKNLKKQSPGVSKQPKTSRMHCEVQLLAYLVKLEKVNYRYWRSIGCSKFPCFCCFILVYAAGFLTAKSHYKVYSPWPIPLRVAEVHRTGWEVISETLLEQLTAINDFKVQYRECNPETPYYFSASPAHTFIRGGIARKAPGPLLP